MCSCNATQIYSNIFMHTAGDAWDARVSYTLRSIYICNIVWQCTRDQQCAHAQRCPTKHTLHNNKNMPPKEVAQHDSKSTDFSIGWYWLTLDGRVLVRSISGHGIVCCVFCMFMHDQHFGHAHYTRQSGSTGEQFGMFCLRNITCIVYALNNNSASISGIL